MCVGRGGTGGAGDTSVQERRHRPSSAARRQIKQQQQQQTCVLGEGGGGEGIQKFKKDVADLPQLQGDSWDRADLCRTGGEHVSKCITRILVFTY